MPNGSVEDIWADAARFDPGLRAKPDLLPVLRRKRIHPQSATREALFAAAAKSRPTILVGIDLPVAGADRMGVQAALLRALAHTFRDGASAMAQVGLKRVRRRLEISELMRRWENGHQVLGITDLHIRGTGLERSIITSNLSRFNLLTQGSEGMRRQEMMTLVVSSRGNVTDSHSDDPDGSNHCFVGRKLWLGWETFEGRKGGLQDCSRDLIHERARFSLRAFCSLKSACWWTVGPGQTLFLPGSLSHRVVTLDPYIGVGSFYCTPASCLENLARWYCHGALWSMDDPAGDNDELVDQIAAAMTRKVRRLSSQSAAMQRQWGIDFAGAALKNWKRRWPHVQRHELMAIRPFANLVGALEKVAQ